MSDSRAGSNGNRQDRPQEPGKFKWFGEPRKHDPSSDARKKFEDLGVPQNKSFKPLDVIKTMFNSPLVPPDAQAQAQAEVRREGLGNSLYQPPEITQKYEAQAQKRRYTEVAKSLVDALKMRGNFERQIAKASRQELSLKNRRKYLELKGKLYAPARALLAVREHTSSSWRSILEVQIRAKTNEINSKLHELADVEETVHKSLNIPRALQMPYRFPYPNTETSVYGSKDFEMPRFSHLTLEDIEDSIRTQPNIEGSDRIPTRAIVSAKLKEFRNYYVELSVLKNAEQGLRAQEAIYRAKGNVLISEVITLTDELEDMEKNEEYFSGPMAGPHQRHLDDSIGKINRDRGDKLEKIRNLQQKDLALIKERLQQVASYYRYLEEKPACKSLMDKLIEREKKNAGEAAEEIRSNWGAATTTPYQFVHKVVHNEEAQKHHIESSSPARWYKNQKPVSNPALINSYAHSSKASANLGNSIGEHRAGGEGGTTDNVIPTTVTPLSNRPGDAGASRSPQDAKPAPEAKSIPDASRVSVLNHIDGQDVLPNTVDGLLGQHQAKGDSGNPKTDGDDASRPPRFDLTQIRDANVKHLAEALNNPQHHRLDIDNSDNSDNSDNWWITHTHDHRGFLTRKWTYSPTEQCWYHDINEDHMLIIGPSNGRLEHYQFNPETLKWDRAELGNPFERYLQPSSKGKEKALLTSPAQAASDAESQTTGQGAKPTFLQLPDQPTSSMDVPEMAGSGNPETDGEPHDDRMAKVIQRFGHDDGGKNTINLPASQIDMPTIPNKSDKELPPPPSHVVDGAPKASTSYGLLRWRGKDLLRLFRTRSGKSKYGTPRDRSGMGRAQEGGGNVTSPPRHPIYDTYTQPGWSSATVLVPNSMLLESQIVGKTAERTNTLQGDHPQPEGGDSGSYRKPDGNQNETPSPETPSPETSGGDLDDRRDRRGSQGGDHSEIDRGSDQVKDTNEETKRDIRSELVMIQAYYNLLQEMNKPDTETFKAAYSSAEKVSSLEDIDIKIPPEQYKDFFERLHTTNRQLKEMTQTIIASDGYNLTMLQFALRAAIQKTTDSEVIKAIDENISGIYDDDRAMKLAQSYEPDKAIEVYDKLIWAKAYLGIGSS